jgi:hypothetical protein
MSNATQAQLERLGAATDSSSGPAARWPTHDRLPREQATDCDKAPLCETPYKIATSNISHRGERFPPPGVDAAKENGHADALLVSFRHYERNVVSGVDREAIFGSPSEIANLSDK